MSCERGNEIKKGAGQMRVQISGGVYCPKCGYGMYELQRYRPDETIRVKCSNDKCILFGVIFYGPTVEIEKC